MILFDSWKSFWFRKKITKFSILEENKFFRSQRKLNLSIFWRKWILKTKQILFSTMESVFIWFRKKCCFLLRLRWQLSCLWPKHRLLVFKSVMQSFHATRKVQMHEKNYILPVLFEKNYLCYRNFLKIKKFHFISSKNLWKKTWMRWYLRTPHACMLIGGPSSESSSEYTPFKSPVPAFRTRTSMISFMHNLQKVWMKITCSPWTLRIM